MATPLSGPQPLRLLSVGILEVREFLVQWEWCNSFLDDDLRGACKTNFRYKLGSLPKEGGVWPNTNFYKSLFLWHIWPFFAENFPKNHRKNPNVRGGGGGGSSRLGQISNFYRKFVLQALGKSFYGQADHKGWTPPSYGQGLVIFSK